MAAVLVRTTPAVAQVRQDPRETARMRFGAIYVTPSIALRDFGVDTNVFNDTTDPKSDLTLTLAPRAQVWLPITRRFLLATSTELGFVYFKSFASQRAVNPTIDARGDLRFNRLSVFGAHRFAWTRERANLELDARVRRRENLSRVGVALDVTPKFGVEVALYHSDFDYETNTELRGVDLRDALQRNQRGLQVGLTHRLTSRTSLQLALETQRHRFDFSSDRNADGYSIIPGVRFSPRALISGTADIGFRRFSPLNPSVPSFSGVVAKTTLGYTIFGATRLGVEVDRDLAYSFDPVDPYYIQTGVGGSIRRQIAGDIDVVLIGKRTRLAYQSAFTSRDRVHTDTVRTLGLDLGYRLNRESRLGVAVAWQERVSSVITSRPYRGFRAGLSVTFGG
jgi:hypothetical protein